MTLLEVAALATRSPQTGGEARAVLLPPDHPSEERGSAVAKLDVPDD